MVYNFLYGQITNILINPLMDVFLYQKSMLLFISGAVEVINFFSLETRLLKDDCSVILT
jgi:hypothetical protein